MDPQKRRNMMSSVTSLHFIILVILSNILLNNYINFGLFYRDYITKYLPRQKLSLISGSVVYWIFHPLRIDCENVSILQKFLAILDYAVCS
jgi:hypothetical protein